MSHEKPTKSTITLNAKKAKWLLEEVHPFVADRPLSKPHVDKLASEMAQGHFLTEMTNITVAILRGKTYRLNGQHTASAVLQVAENDPDFALEGVSLLTYTVTNESDLRQLYARIDRGASRTNKDIAISLLAGTKHFQDVTKRVLRLLPIGLAFMKIEDTIQHKLYSGESAAMDVQGEYLELSKRVATFLGELDPTELHHGHMFRGPVVAALYATFEVDTSGDAETFWTAVATGVGFESENEPAARLRQLLKNVSVGGGTLQRSAKLRLGTEDLYRACIHAWNRFRDGGSFGQALKPTTLASRPTPK